MILHYYFTVLTFVSFLTEEETAANITVHILNYNSSFLLDIYNKHCCFIISEKLYLNSFKLNTVNVSRAFPLVPPLNPVRGLQCLQIPSGILLFNLYKTTALFSPKVKSPPFSPQNSPKN